MKSLFLLVAILTTITINVQASTDCQVFLFKGDHRTEALTSLLKHLDYKSIAEFRENGNFLDYEFNFMPNYYRYGEENDDHYRLMIHYKYESTTIIYNATKDSITEIDHYSTW